MWDGDARRERAGQPRRIQICVFFCCFTSPSKTSQTHFYRYLRALVRRSLSSGRSWSPSRYRGCGNLGDGRDWAWRCQTVKWWGIERASGTAIWRRFVVPKGCIGRGRVGARMHVGVRALRPSGRRRGQRTSRTRSRGHMRKRDNNPQHTYRNLNVDPHTSKANKWGSR